MDEDALRKHQEGIGQPAGEVMNLPDYFLADLPPEATLNRAASRKQFPISHRGKSAASAILLSCSSRPVFLH